jgi:hypothetical protein
MKETAPSVATVTPWAANCFDERPMALAAISAIAMQYTMTGTTKSVGSVGRRTRNMPPATATGENQDTTAACNWTQAPHQHTLTEKQWNALRCDGQSGLAHREGDNVTNVANEKRAKSGQKIRLIQTLSGRRRSDFHNKLCILGKSCT